MSKLLEYYEQHMPSCVYHKYLGIDCPGCGFQRSLVYLLKGDFIGSLKTFPALIPILLMLLYLILHLVFKFEKGHRVLLFLFILNAVIIVTSYLIKILT